MGRTRSSIMGSRRGRFWGTALDEARWRAGTDLLVIEDRCLISVSRDTEEEVGGWRGCRAGADCGWDVTLYIVSWFGPRYTRRVSGYVGRRRVWRNLVSLGNRWLILHVLTKFGIERDRFMVYFEFGRARYSPRMKIISCFDMKRYFFFFF